MWGREDADCTRLGTVWAGFRKSKSVAAECCAPKLPTVCDESFALPLMGLWHTSGHERGKPGKTRKGEGNAVVWCHNLATQRLTVFRAAKDEIGEKRAAEFLGVRRKYQ